MTNIQIGDEILCMNADGMEDHGLCRGGMYSANSVMAVPGQGDYIGVFVEDKGQIVVVDAERFEKAHRINFRVWPDGNYVVKDENFEEVEDETAIDGGVTIPESMLEHLDEVIGLYVAHETANESSD